MGDVRVRCVRACAVASAALPPAMDDNKEKEKEHTGGNPDVPEEEEDDEAKRAVLLGPQVPLKEQLELDKVTNRQSKHSAITEFVRFLPFFWKT